MYQSVGGSESSLRGVTYSECRRLLSVSLKFFLFLYFSYSCWVHSRRGGCRGGVISVPGGGGICFSNSSLRKNGSLFIFSGPKGGGCAVAEARYQSKTIKCSTSIFISLTSFDLCPGHNDLELLVSHLLVTSNWYTTLLQCVQIQIQKLSKIQNSTI